MYWNKIILYGDSLTQNCFGIKGWGATIADEFQRKFDVYNRGLSGYTTNEALSTFDEIFTSEFCKDVSCAILWFGANDSSRGAQHVPLKTYTDNLKVICKKLETCGIDKNKLVLIGPPRCHEPSRLKYMQELDGPDAVIYRKDEITKTYADACDQVGLEYGCKTINMWKEMQKESDWSNLLNDGLHFSEEGNQFVAKLVLPLIKDIVGETKQYLPLWREFHPDL